LPQPRGRSACVSRGAPAGRRGTRHTAHAGAWRTALLRQGRKPTTRSWSNKSLVLGTTVSTSLPETGGFCEARHDDVGGCAAERRLIEAGLNEAALVSALWAEYGASAGATLLPGGTLTGLCAHSDHDPVRAGVGRDVWMLSNVIGRVATRRTRGHHGARRAYGQRHDNCDDAGIGHHGGAPAARGGARASVDRSNERPPQQGQLSGCGPCLHDGARRWLSGSAARSPC
jgi:hypothetical protein